MDVKHHISLKVNLQTAYTYDEDLVSFLKDGLLSSNVFQQVMVGLQCIISFSLLTQKGTNLQLNYSIKSIKSAADICHFLSFALFRMKPLELNYMEYHNNMYFICYHILHTFSTMHYKH